MEGTVGYRWGEDHTYFTSPDSLRDHVLTLQQLYIALRLRFRL